MSFPNYNLHFSIYLLSSATLAVWAILREHAWRNEEKFPFIPELQSMQQAEGNLYPSAIHHCHVLSFGDWGRAWLSCQHYWKYIYPNWCKTPWVGGKVKHYSSASLMVSCERWRLELARSDCLLYTGEWILKLLEALQEAISHPLDPVVGTGLTLYEKTNR